MTSFMGLSPLSQIIILTYFLILLLLNGHILAFGLIRFRRWRISLFVLFHILLYYTVLVGLSTYLYEFEYGRENHPFSFYLASLPGWIYLLLIILATIFTVLVLYRMRLYRKNIISKAAIKESVDNLPVGLSLSFENSFIILSNSQIDRLCHLLTGEDLQDGEAFWNSLVKGDLKEGNQRWSQASNPIITMEDGRTWSFNRRLIKMADRSVVEIVAIDTTDLNLLRLKLEEDNKNLKEMGSRLEEYLKNIMDIKAKEERLATKMSIHDDLGYVLLASRHFFRTRKPGEDLGPRAEKILDLWRENIENLYKPDLLEGNIALDTLISEAKIVGITVLVEGRLPEKTRESDLILLAAGECLTNSVRHARASKLYIKIEEKEEDFVATFTNNGHIPEMEIIEGGGLSGLRYKIQSRGGKMEVTHEPKFTLRVTIAKEGVVKNVPCYDS